MTVLRHFINGQFDAGADAARTEILDPASKTVIGTAPDGTAADVDRAVAAARAAFEDSWRATPPRG